jgi:ribosomal protein S18 acetylase RimI-like enzyme
MATLAVMVIPGKRFGQVHDVVTAGMHRGKQFGREQSLAEELMLLLIEHARSLDLEYLELTSKPSREAANRLYQKLGFQMLAEAVEKDGALTGTNFYRLALQ